MITYISLFNIRINSFSIFFIIYISFIKIQRELKNLEIFLFNFDPLSYHVNSFKRMF